MAAPLLLAGLLAGALAIASQLAGEARVLSADGTPALAAPRDSGLDASAAADSGDDAADGPAAAVAEDASWRYERGALVRPPADEAYACTQPDVAIERSHGCEAGRPYPHCRWRLPDPADGEYAIWRNTIDEHRWARPGLVSLLLAVAAEYRRRWPGEQLVIGDLDAPGPRHQTHDRGVDVDLYLPHAMIARNDGGGRYPDNYEGRARSEVASLRARVMDLAKILATCAGGQIRIYYNDPDVIRPFRAWFDERGLSSDVGPPMRMHNDLHRFHFHLTVHDDVAPLPAR